MKLDSNKGVLRNWLKYFSVGFIVVFALIGLFLTTAFFAVKLHVANDPGAVDYNDRYFQELKDKYGQSSTSDSSKVNGREAEFFHNVLVLNKYYPENSLYILNAYLKSKNLSEAERMIGAVNLYMQDNKGYNSEIKDFEVANSKVGSQRNNGSAVSYTHLRAHETRHDLVCRLLLEKKKT